MKLSKTCLALSLSLSVLWACGGSSSSADSTGAEAAGSGGRGGPDLSLALGGDSSTLSSDNSGPAGAASLARSGAGGVVATGTTACSDGKDNDGDGLIDGFDPECTGTADNDEGTFATGIPGDNRDPKWQDCFFDGNSGAGDDGCRYATGCLTGELSLDDKNCKLSATCIKFCAPLAPNGCDCFGCCTVQLPAGDSVDIETARTCSIDKVDDAKACPRCLKSTVCGNTCGRCELCPGKTVADLPADCSPTESGGAGGMGPGPGPGPGYTCDGGEQVCGTGLSTCALGTYCSQGCCLRQPPR